MYSILLFKENAFDVPIWWSRFMERHGGTNAFKTVESTNAILKEWNVTIRATRPAYEGYGDRYLDFESEEDATLFFLKEAQYE